MSENHVFSRLPKPSGALCGIPRRGCLLCPREPESWSGVHKITSNLLVLNAKDDPCCLLSNAFEASPWAAHHGKTYSELVASPLRGLLAIPNS